MAENLLFLRLEFLVREDSLLAEVVQFEEGVVKIVG
jgi:hypothetical protein